MDRPVKFPCSTHYNMKDLFVLTPFIPAALWSIARLLLSTGCGVTSRADRNRDRDRDRHLYPLFGALEHTFLFSAYHSTSWICTVGNFRTFGNNEDNFISEQREFSKALRSGNCEW